MRRIDERYLAGAVLALFVVGAGAGFFAGGGFATPDGGDGAGTPTEAVPVDGETTAPPPDASATPAQTPTRTEVPPTPTATPPPVTTVAPTPDVEAPGTRTRILIRRFEHRKIRTHLERLLNDWRERKGFEAYRTRGNVVQDLRAMANNHSHEMADEGRVAHVINNRSSVERYRQNKLYPTCKFRRNGENWIVTPHNNRFELIGKTYAGRTYEHNGTQQFNANEREVARAIFDDWISRGLFRYRLRFRNSTHVGIGIETTDINEVYVTANLCGVGPGNEELRLP